MNIKYNDLDEDGKTQVAAAECFVHWASVCRKRHAEFLQILKEDGYIADNIRSNWANQAAGSE